MELQPIDINQIAPYVYIGFGDDPDLIHKYHTIGGTLEKCAQSNIKNIIESIRVFQLRM